MQLILPREDGVLAAEPIIDIAGVRKPFGRTEALGGLSMQVARGKVSALLGPNGAGKTRASPLTSRSVSSTVPSGH